MKKNIIWVLVVALIFSVTACSKTNEGSAKEKTQNTVSTANTNQDDSTQSGSQTEVQNNQSDEKNQPEENESTQEDTLKDKGVDLSLTGEELINSLQYASRPKQFYMETVSTLADGTTATTKSYYYKDNFRTENESDIGLQIMIYNADKGETYTYNDTTKTGMLMSDEADEDNEDDYYDETDISFDQEELYDESVDLVNAEVKELNGEQVVYSVIKTSSEGYDYEVHTYYSIKYGIPIKGETLLNGGLMTSYEVTEITEDIKIDKSIFEKPEDVTFMDLDNLGDY